MNLCYEKMFDDWLGIDTSVPMAMNKGRGVVCNGDKGILGNRVLDLLHPL